MPFPHAANWQVHDAAGRRKYLNTAERQRFLAAADEAAPASARVRDSLWGWAPAKVGRSRERN